MISLKYLYISTMIPLFLSFIAFNIIVYFVIFLTVALEAIKQKKGLELFIIPSRIIV